MNPAQLPESYAPAQTRDRPLNVRLMIDNLGSGGAQRQLVNLAIGLQQRGHRLSVLVYQPADFYEEKLRAAGIPVLRETKKSRFSLKIIADLGRRLREPGLDVVISFLDTPSFYAELASLGPRRPKIIAAERSMAHETLGWRALRHVHRLADGVTTNSHHHRQRLEDQFGFLRGRIRTIYNGVDLQAFSPNPRPTPDPKAPLQLLVVARVEQTKNGLRLIEALHLLRQRGLEPRVNWVGLVDQNHAENQRNADEMRARIAALDLGQQWHWLGERRDVAALMQQHDALVHASYLEGLPNVVCEALACGLPVLASNCLDHPVLVRDGQRGLLFDWQDPVDIANKIEAFAKLPAEQRAAMGAAGRAYAEAELSDAHCAAQYAELIGQLVGR